MDRLGDIINPPSLPVEEIEQRFNELLIYFKRTQGDLIPLPLAIMASSFIPQVPKLLADYDRQKEILNLLSCFAWCIGYSADFSFAGENPDKPI